ASAHALRRCKRSSCGTEPMTLASMTIGGEKERFHMAVSSLGLDADTPPDVCPESHLLPNILAERLDRHRAMSGSLASHQLLHLCITHYFINEAIHLLDDRFRRTLWRGQAKPIDDLIRRQSRLRECRNF